LRKFGVASPSNQAVEGRGHSRLHRATIEIVACVQGLEGVSHKNARKRTRMQMI
jgi:hypothetical protein